MESLRGIVGPAFLRVFFRFFFHAVGERREKREREKDLGSSHDNEDRVRTPVYRMRVAFSPPKGG